MPTIPAAQEFPSPMQQPERQKRFRTAVEFLILIGCTLVFALNAAGIAVTLLTDTYAGKRDFVTYWASGQQLVHRANPYDGAAILQLEHSVGYSATPSALIMRNMPPSLALVVPLGFLSVRVASLLWSLLMLASLWLSIRMIAAMHGREKSQLNLLAYTFSPVLACLIAGQMGLFVLLGLVLFLRLHLTRPFLAGTSLWLCALKPHLFLPFGVVLLVWVVLSRRYSILLGAALAFTLSTAVALVLDPLVFTHYVQMMTAARVGTQLIPCMSTMVRLGISPNSLWLQWLPAVLGCAWALVYFRRHPDWDWIEHGSLLMLVSFVVAPYSWSMDQPVLLPALLAALYRNRSRNLVAVFAILSAVIAVANLRGVPLGNSLLYPWTAPAWLIWYLCAVHSAKVSDRARPERIINEVTSVPEEA
jgi:hypothetical protein